MNRKSPSPFAAKQEDTGVGLRRALLQSWAADPWAFITGCDIDGTPMITTKDEAASGKDINAVYKPMPQDKLYIPWLIEQLFSPEKVVIIHKSRQMMVSTTACLCLYWTCIFQHGRKCMISKTSEELAIELLNDKIRGAHSRTPQWFQELFPMSMTPAKRATFERTNSEIVALPENAASGALRGTTVSIALIDECATQAQFPSMMRAAQPMASRIWGLTTPENGNEGAELCQNLVTAQ